MRIERTILEDDRQQVRFHCSDGGVITRHYEGLENHLRFILSERKMNELSAIVVQAGRSLEDSAAINFYEALSRRIKS